MKIVMTLTVLIILAVQLKAEWVVKMTTDTKDDYISVTNGQIYVDFQKNQFWTIRNVILNGNKLVGTNGGNGTVININNPDGSKLKDPWIGTCHGKEKMKELSVIVDGKKHKWEKGKTLKGKEIILVRKSNIGPMDLEVDIVFASSDDHFVETHKYIVKEDLSKVFNFIYAFMHCHDNALTEWMAITDSEIPLTGKTVNNDDKFHLKQRVKAVTLFNPKAKNGICYVYPEIYDATNSIWDRNVYNKLYTFPILKKADLSPGDTFTYKVAAIPFSSKSENWHQQAKTICEKYNERKDK